MPGRNFENTNTHVMDISVLKLVPQHYPVNVSLAGAPPTGWNYMATATGSTGTTPPRLIVQTTYNMDGVSYILPFYSPGISQTFSIIVINVSSAVYMMGIKQGGSYIGPTQYVYGPGYYSFNFTPSATAGFVTFELWDVTSPPPGSTVFLGPQIELEPITLDSIVLTPMNVVSQIASDDQYHYGFNGQMKTNEWAGVGNHNTALFWEYDTRTGMRLNRDPKGTAWESSYSTFNRNPIWHFDRLGDTVDNTYEVNNGIPKKIDDKGGNTTDHVIVKTPETKAPGGTTLPARTDEYDVPVETYSFGTGGMEYEAFRGPGERIMGHTINDGPIQTVDYEMMFVPLPKVLQLFGRGTGWLGSTAKTKILGDASRGLNYYTRLAKAAGYSSELTGAKVMAGPLVQVNRNVFNVFSGKPLSLVYSNSEATIMGRIWQNQAIGLGTLNIGFSVGAGIHNINLSSRSQNTGGFTVPVIYNLSHR